MRFQVKHAGSGFAAVQCTLKKGETVKAESDAMVTKSQHVELAGRLSGGVLGGLARALLTNESMFLQELTATHGDDNDVLLAPSYPGDIVIIDLGSNDEYILAQGAFLCSDSHVSVTTHTQRLAQGVFSKQGLFLMRARGPGTLAACAYGAIEKYTLRPGEIRDIDNGHLVAWTASTNYSMALASSSWLSSVTSGEGLVCRFTGPGIVYVQTRNLEGLREWIKTKADKGGNAAGACGAIMFFAVLLLFVGIAVLIAMQPGATVSFGDSSRQLHGRRGNQW